MAETKSEEKGIDMSSDSEPLDDASHVVAPGSRASSPTSSPQPEKPASDMPNKRQEKSREPTDISDEAMLHGAPFYIMITSIVLAALLVALNATILGTVGIPSGRSSKGSKFSCYLGDSRYYFRVSHRPRCRLVRVSIPHWLVSFTYTLTSSWPRLTDD